MTYYLLVEREDNAWTPQFGDKDKESVEFELTDRRDHGIKKKDLKILKVKSARRVDCDAAVRALNEKEQP